jgi:agmatinase
MSVPKERRMDRRELERLRARYAEAKGSDIFDPTFAEIARSQFKEGARRRWPFEGYATLAGAPMAGQGDADLARLDAALLGVPMDLGVTNRAGARLGPRAVRAVERIGPYEPALRISPFAHGRIADIGDVEMRSRFSLADCHADIEGFFGRLRDARVRPLTVGGDHSITLPILRALGRGRPLGMIHIDAHADTSGEYEGSKFHHGGPFRQAVLDGALDPKRVIQIGIRGGAGWLWEFSYDAGMTVIDMHEATRMGVPAVVERARAVAGDGPVYVSFDVDSIDPGFAPGTGTPEVGGFQPREVMDILRGLAGLDVVAGDVVEVAPQYDATTATAQIGAQMLFLLLCLVVKAPSFAPKG